MKLIYLTDSQINAGLDYCEAQLAHSKLDDERRELFEKEAEGLREMLVERVEGVIRLL